MLNSSYDKTGYSLKFERSFVLVLENILGRSAVTNYRHRRQAADRPAKVAKRIGCAHKRGCSLEIGWSPIIVKILGHEFLVNFYVTFPCKTTYIALRTERSRDLSGNSSALHRDRPIKAN